jgi:hypothetical protein
LLSLPKPTYPLPMTGVLFLASKNWCMTGNVSSGFSNDCVCTPAKSQLSKVIRTAACLFSLASKT